MNRTMIVMMLVAAIACDSGEPETVPVDAGTDAALDCPAEDWRRIRTLECRVMCGSIELQAPALCPGAQFGDCYHECIDFAPMGSYCPLGPRADYCGGMP